MENSDHDFGNTKFSYAWGLVRSKDKDDIRRGVSLLEELRFADPSRDRECRYYLAVGHFKLGNYGEAKSFILPLIKMEPRNDQFQSLLSEIDAALNRGL